jgi:hypothetical protein
MVLRVALFADKKIEKMPHRVSFFWRWQMRQVAYNIPCWIISHEFDKFIFYDFFSYVETYSENNYRCNTLKKELLFLLPSTMSADGALQFFLFSSCPFL